MDAALHQGAQRALRCRELAAHFFTSAHCTIGDERGSLRRLASVWHEMAFYLENCEPDGPS